MSNNMTGVLINFRLGGVALICDIRSMFFQVIMLEKYRNYTRFFWFKDGDLDGEIIEYRMTVHAFGLTSSPACANFALRTLADMYEEEFGRDAAEFIRKRFYVDDGLAALSNVDLAVSLADNSQALCAKGGFDLRKFSSNKDAVLQRIKPEKLADDVKTWSQDTAAGKIGCTLGMGWDRVRDEFVYQQELKIKKPTRRHMLSALSSVFDPMGLIGPCLLPGRLLLQELCSMKLHWDEEVDSTSSDRWFKWYSELENLRELKIRRSVFKTVNEETIYVYEIHAISDASTHGYGACIYLVIRQGTNVDSALIYAKSKVGPNKNVQIPRMELQAAVLAVQMVLFVLKQLSLDEVTVYYWTDSKIVLGYISNLWKRFHLFVANRVYFIQQHTEIKRWNYISTEDNPADLASRGCTVTEIISSRTWWDGPAVIREPRPDDVNVEVYKDFLPGTDPEIKKTAVVHQIITPCRNVLVMPVIKRQNWFAGLKIVAWMMRFIYNVLGAVRERAPPYQPSMEQGLSVNEIRNAEVQVIKAVQQHAFPDVYLSLERLEADPTSRRWASVRRASLKKHSNLYKLDVYLEGDGTLRVGGRVRRGNLPLDTAHPKLLPKGQFISKMVVGHYHTKVSHAGSSITMGMLRSSGFWLCGGRKYLSQILNDCMICKKVRPKPIEQKMADMPVKRLAAEPPFTYCSADFFGPFHVRPELKTRAKNVTIKRWGCIFVCQSLRAIHIELVYNLTTSSFLMAYRRFANRRGPIRTLKCDRGTNLVGASTELQKALEEMDMTKVRSELLADSCDLLEVEHLAPKSSHAAGAWERQIRSVRSAMVTILAKHGERLTEEELHTFLHEAENVVNSRPITAIESPEGGCDEPLTPARILTLKKMAVMPPPGVFGKTDLYCRERWRAAQYLAEQFWGQWRRDYLPTLQERQKWQNPSANLEPGDLVMVLDQQQRRGKWPMGLVVDVKISEDGLVRSVKVKTQDGVYERPVQKLSVLLRASERPEITRQGAF